MPKFWPRAAGRAANLMMLTPSTGCGLESQTLLRLKLVGMDGRHVAAEKTEMMRRDRPTRQNYTRPGLAHFFGSPRV
jgi:hypothetical protein